LDTQPTTSPNCDFNDGLGYPPPSILTSQVLQADSSIPDSRGCAFEYVIREVYFYQRFTGVEPVEKVAVFLNSYKPGFEGPDSEWLVVTGAIDTGEK